MSDVFKATERISREDRTPRSGGPDNGAPCPYRRLDRARDPRKVQAVEDAAISVLRRNGRRIGLNVTDEWLRALSPKERTALAKLAVESIRRGAK